MMLKKCIGYIMYSLIGGLLPHYEMGHIWLFPKAIRQLCGALIFDECGKNVDIGRKCKLSSKIKIGNNSGIGDYAYIQGNVTIGDDVMMAPRVSIIASNHNFSRKDIPMNSQGETEKPIVIKNNVWIGYGAIILAGVTVGKGAVIAAGAVVTKNVPQNSVVGGVPARTIKHR